MAHLGAVVTKNVMKLRRSKATPDLDQLLLLRTILGVAQDYQLRITAVQDRAPWMLL